MFYILYNTQSDNKNLLKKIDKLYKNLLKTDDCYKLDLKEIEKKEIVFLESLDKDDIVYLCGGDGTLNHFINNVGKKQFMCKIYFYSCGSGNDFKRDYDNKKYIDITNIITKMPKCYINGNEKYYFENGIGIGIDAVVCRKKNQLNFTSVKKNYFKIAIDSFKNFRPYSLDLILDDEKMHFDNVWLVVCNNGKYLGGGMKMCPKAIRDDLEFDTIIIHDVSRIKIALFFPLIYLGLHIKIKGVEYIKCHNFKAIPDGCNIFQMDGETLDYAREVIVKS